MIFSFFSLSSLSPIVDLPVTILVTFFITTFFITALSYCIALYYQHEALKDTINIIIGSLALIVLCVYLFKSPNILSAALVGVISGEILGLLLYELSETNTGKKLFKFITEWV